MGWTAESGCSKVASACRKSSAAARRNALAAAYAHTACAAVQPALPSCFAGRERYRDLLPRAPALDLHRESLPSTPRTAFPPSPSGGAPSLRAWEACLCHCARLSPPSHAAKLLLLVPALRLRIRRALAASLFPASRRCLARMLQSEPLQIPARAELFRRRSHLPSPLSYLRPRPARPASSTPDCLLSSISTYAGQICQRSRLPRGARPPTGCPRSSRFQSAPNPT